MKFAFNISSKKESRQTTVTTTKLYPDFGIDLNINEESKKESRKTTVTTTTLLSPTTMTTMKSTTKPIISMVKSNTEPTIPSTSTTMTMKSTSPTTTTKMKVEKTFSPSSTMNNVDVDVQRKIEISKWKPIVQKKTSPRKLEDESSNSNSYYPVVRNNPGRHYLSNPPPPSPHRPLADIPFMRDLYSLCRIIKERSHFHFNPFLNLFRTIH